MAGLCTIGLTAPPQPSSVPPTRLCCATRPTRTWCGSAEESRSKSLGVPPSSRSRTVPPTTYTSWPASRGQGGPIMRGMPGSGRRAEGVSASQELSLKCQAAPMLLPRRVAPHLQLAGATAPARRHVRCRFPGWGGHRLAGYVPVAMGKRCCCRCCCTPHGHRDQLPPWCP